MKYGIPLSAAGMWKRRWSSLALLVCTCFYANFFAKPFLAVAVLLGVGLLWGMKDRTLPHTRKITWYAAMAIAGLTLLGNSLWPGIEENFGFFGGLLQAQYLIPVLIYLTFFYLMQSQTNYYSLLVVIATVFMICVASELLPNEVKRQLHQPWITLPFALSAQVISVCGICGLFLWFGGISEISHPRRFFWYAIGVLIVVCAAGYPAYRYFVQLHKTYEAKIYQVESELGLKPWRMIYAQMPSRKMTFGAEMDLSRPFSGLEKFGEDEILIRAEGNSAPGYLRMFAYRSFSGQSWSVGGGSGGANLTVAEDKSKSAITYQLTAVQSEPGNEYLFAWSSMLLADSLAMQGNWQQVQLISEDVILDADGRFRSEDWQRSGGYRVVVSDNDPEAAYPFPQTPDASYLEVPEAFLPVLDTVISEIPGLTTTAGSREKLRALQEYFSKFEYDMSRVSYGANPVETFLRQTHKGHCELFASAAALLARRLGMPSRYVSGFLCFERHPSGNYYLSRVSHAHAWAEVFLPEEQRWIILETTPADSLPAQERVWSFSESNMDRLRFGWEKLVAALKRGDIAAFITALFINPIAATLILFVGMAGVWFQYGRRRKKRVERPLILSARQKQWQQMAQQQIASWKKQGNLTDNPGWTIEDYVAQVNVSSAFSPEEKSAATTFAQEYEAGRFNAETR